MTELLGILPIFDRDRQVCTSCSHTCGYHDSFDRDGEFAGIGLGQCDAGHWTGDPWESVTNPASDCQRFTLAGGVS